MAISVSFLSFAIVQDRMHVPFPSQLSMYIYLSCRHRKMFLRGFELSFRDELLVLLNSLKKQLMFTGLFDQIIHFSDNIDILELFKDLHPKVK